MRIQTLANPSSSYTDLITRACRLRMLRRGADHVTFCWGFLNLIMEISEESHREMGANQNSVAKSQHELGRGNFPWNFLYELSDRLRAKGPPVFISPAWRLKVRAATPRFHMGTGDPSSSPHPYTTSILPTEPFSPESSDYS